MHLMHKLMVTAHQASAHLHIHVPHYTHFIPFMSKNKVSNFFQITTIFGESHDHEQKKPKNLNRLIYFLPIKGMQTV